MRTIDEVLSQPWSKEFPRALQIETISLCNARCTFCPYVETAQMFPAGGMSVALYEKIVAELKEHQPQLVAPYLNNEPLLDKKIVERIRLLRQALPQVFIDISTNGSALTQTLAEQLVDPVLAIDEIKINFPSTDPEEYKRIMGLDYQKTLRNVRLFIETAQQTGFKGRYTIICVGRGISESENKFWSELVIPAKKYTKISRGGIIETDHAPKKRISGCKYDREREWLHILNTGEVVLCCMDWYRQHIIGDLRKSSIVDIWNSDQYREIRQRVRDCSDPSFICNKCEWSLPYERS